MSPTNNTQVLIGGNVYTLSGDESEEYIQRVALYINNKLDEIKETENAKTLNTRLLSVLLEINMADDFFKVKEKNDILNVALQEKEDTIYNLGKRIEFLEKSMKDLNEKNDLLKSELASSKEELDEYIELFDKNE